LSEPASAAEGHAFFALPERACFCRRRTRLLCARFARRYNLGIFSGWAYNEEQFEKFVASGDDFEVERDFEKIGKALNIATARDIGVRSQLVPGEVFKTLMIV
jgi:hypothetical protein